MKVTHRETRLEGGILGRNAPDIRASKGKNFGVASLEEIPERVQETGEFDGPGAVNPLPVVQCLEGS